MMSLDSHRKLCLQQQSELRRILTDSQQYDKAMGLFFEQHAMLHSAEVDPTGLWSYEDTLLEDVPEARMRWVPPGQEHSMAWILWHIARCEDITMNLLVAGGSQVLNEEPWLQRLNIGLRHTGNAMDESQVADFSSAIDIQALRAYRLAVGRRTREIVRDLKPGDLKRKMDSDRLNRIWEEGALLKAAQEVFDYWARRNVAGLLLMPATRHNLIHLNEALEIKRRRYS
jgi:hypothetical protein